MSAKLHGRYGAYEPRTPEEKALAKRQQAKRAANAAAAQSWKERHRWCVNGCGREAVFYSNGTLALRFGGACSAECLAEFEARDVPANDTAKGPERSDGPVEADRPERT